MQLKTSLNKVFYSAALVLTCLNAPPSRAEETPNFIKNLTGCFKVTFRYIEDGTHDQNIDELYEWISPTKEEAETSLQHVGVIPAHEKTPAMAFKHWHEAWTKNGDDTWSQVVTGPYGDFRYQCSAPILFNQWHCKAGDAPKPRRDKDRKDYQTLVRDNTLQATPKGWVQVENNTKIDRNGNAVSNEVGWNEYRRVDEKECQAAKEFLSRSGNK